MQPLPSPAAARAPLSTENIFPISFVRFFSCLEVIIFRELSELCNADTLRHSLVWIPNNYCWIHDDISSTHRLVTHRSHRACDKHTSPLSLPPHTPNGKKKWKWKFTAARRSLIASTKSLTMNFLKKFALTLRQYVQCCVTMTCSLAKIIRWQ